MELTIPRHRLVAALGAAVVQALLLYALFAGLTVHMPVAVEEGLKLFGVVPQPPPPPERPKPPPPNHSSRPKGAPAPPNLRSKATEVAAPKPVVVMPVPPLIVTATKPYIGAQATSGAAEVAGPGTGAGGTGSGYGGGGDGGDGIGPRWRKGRLKDSDYPADAGAAGVSGVVGVRYLVGIDGRVGECRITRSSGSTTLDATTCTLIRQRFRYDPARDEDGNKVPAWIVETHSWVIERNPDPEPDGN